MVLGTSLGALALLAPGMAVAQCTETAPGDNAQVDEYAETIPGACGDHPTGQHGDDNQTGTIGGGGSDGGTGDPAAVPQASVEQLEALGADGEAVANLAQSTSPAGGSSEGNGGNGGGGGTGSGSDSLSAGAVPVDSDDGSVLSGVTRAIGGESSDGLGIVLPLILGSVLLAGVAYLVRRRTGATHA